MNINPTAVALGFNIYRVFGLNSRAWRDARASSNRSGSQQALPNGAGTSAADGRPQDEPSEFDLQKSKIDRAVEVALSDDAGGFGTVGFHKNKVQRLRQLSSQCDAATFTSTYRADLVPCDAEGVPLDPVQIATKGGKGDDATDDSEEKFYGNDALYVTSKQTPFQIQIVITCAARGVPMSKLRAALYAHGKEAVQDGAVASEGCIGGISVNDLVNTDEKLKELNDKLDDRVEEGVKFKSDNEPEGFYVEVMLLEPNISEDDAVVSPPDDLNKVLPTFQPFCETAVTNGGNASLYQSVYTTPQFTSAIGPWEAENIKAFRVVALDVQKALVRVEFPEFQEGCKDKTFREVYQLNARLKSGSFATVCKGTHRATGKKIAVKCVLREDLPPNDDAAIYDEVLILSTLKHPLICPLIDFFEERECYFLVMELMTGGDLFDRIGEKKNYTEQDARTLCKKMIESVCFCHENSVAHRDMKPKNLLLVDEDDDCAVKLADFGFATRVYEPRSLTKQCGTPFFIAPEVLLRQRYDERSDMWSVGVITYLLLAGDLPFTGRSQKELFQNIVRGEFSFPEESWGTVSIDAKNLLRKLLVTDPSHRLTSKEAMQSRWMIQRADRLQRNTLLYTSQRLKTFNARMKLRSAMIAVTAMTSARLSIARSIADVVPIESDGESSNDAEDEETKNE